MEAGIFSPCYSSSAPDVPGTDKPGALEKEVLLYTASYQPQGAAGSKSRAGFGK